MKRIVLVFAALLVLSQTAGCIGVLGFPRHIDPDTLDFRELDGVVLFDLYGLLFGEIRIENFTMAWEGLRWAREVYTDSELMLMLNAYHDLIEVEIRSLNLTASSFQLAIESFKLENLGEFERFLSLIIVNLQLASLTLDDLEIEAVRIASYLGVSPAQVLEELQGVELLIEKYNLTISMAIELLEEVDIDDVKELLEIYPDLIDQVQDPQGQFSFEVISDIILGKIEFTVLEIESDRDEVELGEQLTISGRLRTFHDEGIPDQEIRVVLENGEVSGTYTNEHGWFSYVLTVPYLYQETLRIHAEYWPSGTYAEMYSPAMSNVLSVSLQYFTPELHVAQIMPVYPGDVTTIKGAVSHNRHPIKNLVVEIEAYESISEIRTDENGVFEKIIEIPLNAENEVEDIQIQTQPRGIYGPAEKVFSILLRKLSIVIFVDTPPSEFKRKVTIQGAVFVRQIPLENCIISVESNEGIMYSKTDENGFFRTEVTLPPTLFSKVYSLTLVADPVEPMLGSSTVTNAIRIYNLISITSILAIFGTLITVSGRMLQQTFRLNLPPKIADTPFTAVSQRNPAEKPDSQDPGLSQQYNVVTVIMSRITGFTIRPAQTIREYLIQISGKVNRALYEHFRRLSLIYEKWLYGRSRRYSKKTVTNLFKNFTEHPDEN